jgi:hypothetical protein
MKKFFKWMICICIFTENNSKQFEKILQNYVYAQPLLKNNVM